MVYFRRNEKGYTLLLTLLVIIIIVSLFTTFAFASVTQQKQVEKTDLSFEAMSVTEMGVEYYQTAVLNIYLTNVSNMQMQLDDCIQDLDSKEPDYEQEIRTNCERPYIEKIKDEINLLPENYTIADNVYFIYEHQSVKEQNGLIMINMEVRGFIPEESKSIKAYFKLPLNLLIVKESDGDTEGTLINPPDFTKTYPTPPSNIMSCPSDSKNWYGITCITDNLKDMDYLSKSTVFLTKGGSFSNLNNNDYENSTLYVDGGLTLSNINKNTNISYYINGEATFDNLNSSTNVIVQTNGPASFGNGKSINNVTVYANGGITMGNIGGEKLTLYSNGPLTTNNIVLSNSTIEVKGEGTFDNSSFSNSNIHITGTSSFKDIELDRSTVYLDAVVNSGNSFKLTNESKACLRGPGVLGKLEIDHSSHVYLLEGSAFTYDDYKGSKSPERVSEKDFEKLCSIAGKSPGYDVEVDPNTSVTEDDIIDNIEYSYSNGEKTRGGQMPSSYYS